MKDKFGRMIDYLRISLTENCNVRCLYCMPDWNQSEIQSNEKILSASEVIEISKMFAELGIKKIRLTGGEPLVRKDLTEIIAGIKNIESIKEICLTTNGILLDDKILELKNAGLNRVNISLDTMDGEEYKKITRGGDISKVLNAIKKCVALDIPVKINAVITNIQDSDSIKNLAEISVGEKIDVRFIELMPIGYGKNLKGFTGQEIVDILEKNYELENLYEFEGTSKYYQIKNAKGRIGVINPMSDCFCDTCNRVRITSEGGLKSCLSTKEDFNLRDLLKKNISPDEKKEIIMAALFNKKAKSGFGGADSENKTMNKIGG
ncbi:MAG: GTP 3',8-cyclase MoaA [Fusobacteriaceae bacterium]